MSAYGQILLSKPFPIDPHFVALDSSQHGRYMYLITVLLILTKFLFSNKIILS